MVKDGFMEKERPQERPPEDNNPDDENLERDDVHLSANRCPYCHENVQISALDWVACRSCQARHHKDCWSELGCCGSCKEERYLSDASETSQPQVQSPVTADTSTAPIIDTNMKQRRLAKGMAIMFALAVAIAIALSVSGEVPIGGVEIGLLSFMTVMIWSYAKSGVDPMGFGQPIGSKIKKNDDPKEAPKKTGK